jgi:hypothetical protein
MAENTRIVMAVKPPSRVIEGNTQYLDACRGDKIIIASGVLGTSQRDTMAIALLSASGSAPATWSPSTVQPRRGRSRASRASSIGSPCPAGPPTLREIATRKVSLDATPCIGTPQRVADRLARTIAAGGAWSMQHEDVLRSPPIVVFYQLRYIERPDVADIAAFARGRPHRSCGVARPRTRGNACSPRACSAKGLGKPGTTAVAQASPTRESVCSVTRTSV